MRRLLIPLLLILLSSIPSFAGKKDPGRIEILVDASASMASAFGSDGSDRLGAIRNALDILAPALSEEQPKREIALRVFGGGHLLGEAGACEDTRLLLGWSLAAEARLDESLDGIGSRGASCLGAALEAVREDFGPIQEKDALLILLDGLDSCREDGTWIALDRMQEEGLKVLVLGIGLSFPDRPEISSHAALKPISDFNGFIATMLEVLTGLGPAEMVGLTTEFHLTQTSGIARLDLRASMIPGIKSMSPEDFPLKVQLPAGSLSATAVDPAGEELGRLLRIPILPGHRISLDIPEFQAAELEAVEMPTGWDIRPSLDVRFKKAPASGGRLVLQRDPSPGASWVWASKISDSEGHQIIPLPERSGDYQLQLRTRSKQGEIVLAELKIKAPGHWISIDAPSEGGSDTPIPIQWKSMAAPGDFLTIVPSDTPYEYIGVRYPAGDGLDLDFPPLGDACDWEIRYISGLDNSRLAKAKIEIKDPRAGILPPEKAEVSGTIEILFFGPRDEGDMISLAPEDSAPGDYISSTGTEREPCFLEAPAKAGTYRVRYLSADLEILADESIEITQNEIVLSAPDSVPSGGRIRLSWENERSPEDYIAIAVPEAPLFRRLGFVYVSMGSPTTLAAPTKKGVYELRYISKGEILLRRTIRVE